VAVQHQRELVLGMEVPLRAVALSAHHLAVEGFPLPLGRVLEDGTGFDGGPHGKAQKYQLP
jgi:hypothetical protein